MKKWMLFVLSLPLSTAFSQTIQIVDSSQTASFRGLCVVTNDVIWASGSKGTVLLTTDGGITWNKKQVPGFESTDFRDIEAFDKKTAIIMGVARPAYILKTTDGGDSWKVVYENRDTTMFLDAMEFWNDMSGIVIGDPSNGRFFIGRTFDGGDTWQTIPDSNKPVALPGEACFAASGTNIRRIGRDEAVFVSGGEVSRFFRKDQQIVLPVRQGESSSGANSIAVGKKAAMVVVGGDFTQPADTTGNCAFSTDGGQTWKKPATPPGGYRSCVEHLTKNNWITCGLTGVDISKDNGNTWQSISPQSFHVVRKAKKGKAVFLAGNNGRIGKLSDPDQILK